MIVFARDPSQCIADNDLSLALIQLRAKQNAKKCLAIHLNCSLVALLRLNSISFGPRAALSKAASIESGSSLCRVRPTTKWNTLFWLSVVSFVARRVIGRFLRSPIQRARARARPSFIAFSLNGFELIYTILCKWGWSRFGRRRKVDCVASKNMSAAVVFIQRSTLSTSWCSCRVTYEQWKISRLLCVCVCVCPLCVYARVKRLKHGNVAFFWKTFRAHWQQNAAWLSGSVNAFIQSNQRHWPIWLQICAATAIPRAKPCRTDDSHQQFSVLPILRWINSFFLCSPHTHKSPKSNMVAKSWIFCNTDLPTFGVTTNFENKLLVVQLKGIQNTGQRKQKLWNFAECRWVEKMAPWPSNRVLRIGTGLCRSWDFFKAHENKNGEAQTWHSHAQFEDTDDRNWFRRTK